jgi:long-subunit fatty acid transport protein
MDLSTSEHPRGPGVSEPQLWRSTFTVGMGTDWQVSQLLTLHAGYRFYDNPVPDGVTAGAFPNANQHVTAVAMRLQEGPHALALIYGLDFLDAASSSGISSARQGENIESLAHLVSFTYNYAF